MGSREKTQSDIDLETFVDLFDTALSSDNPAVKKALKNLMLITTMVQSEISPEQRMNGPLRQVIDDIKNLNRRLNSLESQRIYPQQPVIPPVVSPNIPTPWVITSPTTQPNTVGPSWPPYTITSSADATTFVEALKSEDC